MQHLKFVSVLILGGLASAAAPGSALAAGDPAAPKPDVQQKKVWTNDEVERLNPDFAAIAARRAREKSAPTAATQAPASAPIAAQPARVRLAVAAPLPPQKDPAWYGEQITGLQAELAGIESHELALQAFRSSGTTAGTGLVLNAPCTGISTDNLIANLELERQRILAQIDELGDVARANALPPGILVEGRGLAQPTGQLTPRQERAIVAGTAQVATAQLAEVQATIASMEGQAAALHATLQQPVPGFGGNMTTDLLDRLGARASALESVIDNAGDAGRSIGMAPGDLR